LAMPLRMRGQRELRRFHGVQRDLGFRSAERACVPLALAPVEFALLAALARTPGRPWRREDLLAEVRRDDDEARSRMVDVRVHDLRRKLGEDRGHPRYVHTVRGVGYAFYDPQGDDGARPANEQ